jgi:hypothetical protein
VVVVDNLWHPEMEASDEAVGDRKLKRTLAIVVEVLEKANTGSSYLSNMNFNFLAFSYFFEKKSLKSIKINFSILLTETQFF